MSLLKNASWLLAEKILRIAVGFVVNLAVIRHLGPEDMGRYAFALSVVYLAMPFARAGLEALIVRELSGSASDSARGATRFAFIRLAAGAIVAAAVVALAPLIARTPADRLLILVATGLLVLQAADVFELWAQSQALAWRTAAMRIGVIGVAVLARIVLIAADAGPTAFVVVVLAEALASGACAFALWWRHRSAIPWRTAKRPGVPWLEARTVLLTSLVATVFLRIDAPLLMWWTGPEQAGVHAAALPFVDALGIVPMVIGTVLLPELTRLWRAGEDVRERFWTEFQSAMAMATWVGLCASGALAVFAVFALGGLLGQGYSATVPVVLVLCAVVPVLFQGSVMDLYVYVDSRTTFLLVKSACVLALKLLLAAWWIPEHGALGAAASTAVAVWAVAYPVTRAMSARVFSVAVRAYSPVMGLAALRRLVSRLQRSTREQSR